MVGWNDKVMYTSTYIKVPLHLTKGKWLIRGINNIPAWCTLNDFVDEK